MPEEVDYSQLIPELSAWNNGKGIDVDSWLGCMGNIELAIAFSRLFWPSFVEHDGCVLFTDFSEATYASFLHSTKGNRASVERVMNHRHIQDLFTTEKPSTLPQILHLGRVLKDIFTTKLTHHFPDRTFVVEFDEGPFEDRVQYQVTFWQSNNCPAKQ